MSAALARPEDIASLPTQQRGEIITRALEESKSWLAVATKGTDPTPIAEFKAWAATVAEMTRQKGLAEDIQLDALEMVRRAERGIGVAIRNGQAAGEIRARGQREHTANQWGRAVPGDNLNSKGSPYQYATADELHGNGAGIYRLTDGVSDERFDDAVTTARAEKNLSRANVIRNARGSVTRPQKAVTIRELASAGYSSRQMAGSLGVSDETVRAIAREHDIEIPADRVTAGTRRIDPERVLRETVSTLQGVEYGLGLLSQADYDAFTTEQVRTWLGALNSPSRAIRVLLKELNSRVH